MGTAVQLVPTYDFEAVTKSLQADPGADLATLLNKLAQIPAPAATDKPVVKKKVDPVAEENFKTEILRVTAILPEVVGKVTLPATPRVLRNTELAALIDESEQIGLALKALKAREDKIKNAVSGHFDVTAEKSGKAKPGETPVDDKGHYLIGGSSAEQRLEAPVPGKEKRFVREKSKGSSRLSFERLLAAYEEKQITKAEFLAFTREVTYRELDPAQFTKGLLSRARRERTQEIMTLISEASHGTNSVRLR
ncbi:hypothetical protein ACH4S8_37525 [Streptomyces sp. NPDC021080]|uniref:hypothetical protein n=1 Tax=Streptomyces sp. NPDC021080 TaxID=3365110 RepID=UPI0037A6B34B